MMTEVSQPVGRATGSRFYFASNRTGRSQIWKLPVNGGRAIQMTKKGGVLPVESPDGQIVYYLNEEETGLWKISVGGAEETRVLEPVLKRAFVVVAEGIYYITPAPDLTGQL